MKKWISRAMLGGVAAGLALAAQGAPAMATPAPANAAPDSCPSSHDAVAGYTGYATSTASCAWITSQSSKNAQHRRYTWWIPEGSNAKICVQAQGHTWSPSAKKNVSRWYSAGCGSGGTVSVPWHAQPAGSGYYGIAAKPRVRAKVEPGTPGSAYSWS